MYKPMPRTQTLLPIASAYTVRAIDDNPYLSVEYMGYHIGECEVIDGGLWFCDLLDSHVRDASDAVHAGIKSAITANLPA